jgi:putative DNA primase/helicase
MNSSLFNEMEAAGLLPAEPLAMTHNGELQRYQVEGDKRGSKNGWVVSYHNAGAPSVHIFGSWKAGVSRTFVEGEGSQNPSDTRKLIEQAQRQARLRKEREQQEVAEKCAQIWASLPPANLHPYLMDKRIKPHIARCWDESLVIPLVDFNMVITSLQFINPNGGKTFRKGGKVSGSFCPLGCANLNSFKSWVVCEGFATGASIHEATGLPVLVAFNANNLKPITTSLRMLAPTAQIIIAADNDRFTKIGNVGVTKAEQAANDANAFVIVPQFDTEEGSDFNDLAQQKGLKIISQIFMEVAA